MCRTSLFRFWHVGRRKMYAVLNVRCGKNDFIDCLDPLTGKKDTFNTWEGNLMCRTIYKDVNGTYIYEYDVVKFTYRNGKVDEKICFSGFDVCLGLHSEGGAVSAEIVSVSCKGFGE